MDENRAERNEVLLVEGTAAWLKRALQTAKVFLTQNTTSGRPAAVVLFLVLFAVSFSSKTAETHTGSVRLYSRCLNVGYAVAAVICLTLMLYYTKPRRVANAAAAADGDGVPSFIRRNIKLFGLVSFYVGVFVLNVFHMIADWRCIDTWLSCVDAHVRAEHMVHLAYQLYITPTYYFC